MHSLEEVDLGSEANSEEKILPQKRKHTVSEGCSLFPLHTRLFFIYISLAIILPSFGTTLLIYGSYANTGYFSFFAILNWPWPKLDVEEQDYTAMSLEILYIGCWICGFFFLFFSVYVWYMCWVFYKLLWSPRPWNRHSWNGARKDADNALVKGDVRHESLTEQFERLNDKQQNEVRKFIETRFEDSEQILVVTK